LAVRQGVKKILYSQTRISVEFDYSHPFDGKNRPNSFDSPVPRLETDTPAPHAPQKQKGSGRLCDQTPVQQFDSFKVAEVRVSDKTVLFTFPNIAHNFWANYRLIKQYHIRETETSNRF
jgi:hypothetical protein